MFPTPWTILHMAYAGTTNDSHGNQVETWADPVPRAVYGWAAPQFTEPMTPGVTSEVVTLIVYSPKFDVGERDRFAVDGKTYDIVGEAGDYDHGPFGFHPGMVINLKRSD